jgi:hypothetical protein
MGRGLIGCLALSVAAASALADPKIDSAISVFKQTQANAGKFKSFCAMSKAREAPGENEGSVAKAQIEGYLTQLGPDFETSWRVPRG